MNPLFRVRFHRTLKALSERKFLPPRVEVVPCPGGYFANIAPEEVDPVISDQVATGYAGHPELALMKAMSELVEREAFKAGKAAGDLSCQTPRSDGFAAFPTSLRTRESCRREARARALDEAIERYVWANWWDDPRIGHSTSDGVPFVSRFPRAGALLSALSLPCSVKGLYAIAPAMEASSRRVIILICELENGGFLSGGACGSAERLQETVERAAAELFRHCLAFDRLSTETRPPKGFYQQRLAHFASGEGRDAVLQRLGAKGSSHIRLPALVVDTEISHVNRDIVHVHRCLFENQPPFIGGALERFCI